MKRFVLRAACGIEHECVLAPDARRAAPFAVFPSICHRENADGLSSANPQLRAVTHAM